MTEEQIAAAAIEIGQYVRELFAPWTTFTGHEDAIAEIIRKHAKDS